MNKTNTNNSNNINNPSTTNISDYYKNYSNNKVEQESLNPVSVYQLNKFKEDIFKSLKDIENKVYLETLDFRNELAAKVSSLEKVIEDQTKYNNEFSEKVVSFQIQNERFNVLESNYRKLYEESVTQGVRVKNMDKQITDGFYKYDKMYLDHLSMPGIIGEYCKYKTLKDYVEFTSSQITMFNNFKDKHSLELKTYKDKLDSIINQFHLQVSHADRNNRDYTNLKIEAVEKSLNKEKTELDKKIMDSKIENSKHARELLLNTEKLKNEQYGLVEFKENVNKEIKEGIDKMKRINNDTIIGFESVKDEFDTFKRKFNNIAEFIKDIRFRRNLGADVQKREIKNLSNKIEYNNLAVKSFNHKNKGNNDEYIDYENDYEYFSDENKLDQNDNKSDLEAVGNNNSISENNNAKDNSIIDNIDKERKVKILINNNNNNNKPNTNIYNTDNLNKDLLNKKNTNYSTYDANKLDVESVVKSYIQGKKSDKKSKLSKKEHLEQLSSRPLVCSRFNKETHNHIISGNEDVHCGGTDIELYNSLHYKQQGNKLNTETVDTKLNRIINSIKEEKIVEECTENFSNPDSPNNKSKKSKAHSNNKDLNIYLHNDSINVNKSLSKRTVSLGKLSSGMNDNNNNNLSTSSKKQTYTYDPNYKSANYILSNVIMNDNQVSTQEKIKFVSNEFNYFKNKAISKFDDSEKKITDLEVLIKDKYEEIVHLIKSYFGNMSNNHNSNNNNNNSNNLNKFNVKNSKSYSTSKKPNTNSNKDIKMPTIVTNTINSNPSPNYNVPKKITSKVSDASHNYSSDSILNIKNTLRKDSDFNKNNYKTHANNTPNNFSSNTSNLNNFNSNNNNNNKQSKPSMYSNHAHNAGTLMIADSVYNKNITYNIVDSNNAFKDVKSGNKSSSKFNSNKALSTNHYVNKFANNTSSGFNINSAKNVLIKSSNGNFNRSSSKENNYAKYKINII